MEAAVSTEREKRFRKTRNISLTPADERFIRAQAERYHGGNVSRYVQFLIRRDQQAEAERAQRSTEATAA